MIETLADLPMYRCCSPFYNDSHRAVRRVVRDFVEKEITPFCHEWDEAKSIPKEVFQKAAKIGILAAACHHAPPELIPYGYPAGIKPEEWDAFHNVVVVDELSRCGSGGVSNRCGDHDYYIT